MNDTTKQCLFWSLIILAILTSGLLFLGPEDLLGTIEDTEFVLKTLLYPIVLGVIILAWGRLDKKMNKRKPEDPD